MAVMVVGLLLFLSNFIIMPMSIGNGFPENPGGLMTGFALRGVGGMVLLIVGGIMRGIGARGWAGSGMVLDPQRARRDLEPYARMGGGLVGDAMGEIPAVQRLGQPRPPAMPVVKVRCRHCQALNDESDKFCGQCGKAM